MFKTLSMKLLVVILPLITLAVILLFGLLEFRDFNARLQAKERQLIRLADTAAAALIQPIWEYNAKAIREVLNDLSRDPNLLSVSVTDIGGHELAGIGDNQDIRHEPNLTAESDVVFTSGKRVEKLGKVRIAFHRDELKRHVNERLTADSIVLAGLIFTLTMLIVLATQRVIGRPVAALNRSIIRMQEQNYREPVEWKSSDELGLFIKAYNKIQRAQDEAETELKRYSNELEQRVDQRTAELAAANEAKSNFLANMSHEIRTPMNSVIGMTQLCLKTELNSKQRKYLQNVDQAANLLLGVINDVLDLSKIEAGQLTIERINFSVEDVLDRLRNIIGLKAQEKDIELLFDVDNHVPAALIGDPFRLGQVLINLLNNAVKFTAIGEVIVKVKCVDNIRNEVKLRFSVCDTGIGLSDKQQASVFHPFTQADSSTTRKYGGSGLGLSICKDLVERMDGQIWVESEVGAGSRFIFEVIFEQGEIPLEQQVSLSKVLALKRALVVDDNAASREILQQMVLSLGIEVVVASSGLEALAELQTASESKRPFQLVLMDWKMPNMDGLEAMRRIREDKKLTDIPTVIMVSAYSSEEALTEAGPILPEDFLVKPVSPSTLLNSINTQFSQQVRSRFRREVVEFAGHDFVSQLKGVRVLLVDDHEMNQELAIEILTEAGMKVTLANNGQEALDCLAKQEFDGVLMDIQMPIMDGYTATREIRKQKRFSSLPIIAMTANAMAADRDKAIQAGMNDYLAKPVNFEYALKTLAKWFTNKSPDVVTQSSNLAEEIKKNYDFTQLEGIDTNIGLEIARGNQSLYLRLLTKFAKSETNFKNRFLNALKKNDIDSAVRFAHSLKGAANSIGAMNVGFDASSLEQMVSDSVEMKTLSEYLEKLQCSLELVLTSISKMSTDTTYSEQVTRTEYSILLKKLRILLQENDAGATELSIELKSHPKLKIHQGIVKQLVDFVSEYDFDSALDTLKVLQNLMGEKDDA